MIPAAFEYFRPQTIEAALELLEQHGTDAKLLAGGHSLLPAMKLRLAQPAKLIDLARIPELDGIRLEQDRIAIGAMTTHQAIASSALLAGKCPLLPEVARQVGDVQVRNRGTLGGSLAHADPAGDWPAAMLALEAEIVVGGRGGNRAIAAGDFFVDLYETALRPAELIREIRVPVTAATVAYVKSSQRASGFAVAGAAVVVDGHRKWVGVAISGVAAKPYRATKVEKKLTGKSLTAEAIAAAAACAAAGIEPLSDMHGSAEFRAHLARVNTARALASAAGRG
ncbi:MAG: xanthine dehydrogenase family protein subunit M [Verrucomicrobia bacterium]|nr:xanthine dehydrogenase family protein subunit M [Verrucomicrobiota bacterium]